jgi:hypothetical protein
MRQRVRDLIEQSDRLFSKRQPLLSTWQTIAENFCPIRADFTSSRTLGDEFMSHLMTGRPVLAHRDLGNALSSMLRPRGQTWFHARTDDDRVNEDATAKQWLDHKSDTLRRIMYDQRAQFVRATKQGDHDFVAFGQTVIEVSPNRTLDGALYRCWHLRDVAWCEDEELRICRVDRKWKLEAVHLKKLFPKTVSGKVDELCKKDPYHEVNCLHIVLPADQYDYSDAGKKVNKAKFPFVSIYVDCENDTILEETPRKRLGYVIPRWVTVPGSQYAHSPASVTALPDARMLQQMTLTLLEAGQKAVDPPMKATQEAVVGAVNAYAGGITWVDSEYDEKMGAALETLIDTSKFNLNWGVDREERVAALIAEAFYLNKITLPDLSGGDMTAYEVQKRIEEYIRGALPLFEPMEVEYNGGLCEESWELAMDMGGFGPLDDMPDILKGKDLRWQFDSPLQAATERGKAQAFVESTNLLKVAAEIDPTVRHDFDLNKAFREALSGTGARADWIVPEEQAEQAKAQERQMMAIQQAAQTAGMAGQVAQQVGAGAQEMQMAGMV